MTAAADETMKSEPLTPEKLSELQAIAKAAVGVPLPIGLRPDAPEPALAYIKAALTYFPSLVKALAAMPTPEAALAVREARNAALDEAAKLVAGIGIDGRYVTWPCWNPKGNVSIESEPARLSVALFDALRALKSKEA